MTEFITNLILKYPPLLSSESRNLFLRSFGESFLFCGLIIAYGVNSKSSFY